MTAHEPETEGLTCREVVGLLADYLESALGQERMRELEEHLAGCEPCRAYLNTYRATRHLVGREGRAEMPPELKARLREFILGRLRDQAT